MYTKGVWERRGNQVVVVGSGLVAHCPSPSKDGAMEFIANAQLIAAAPDMYEALKELLKWAELSYTDDTGEWADEFDPAILQTKEAIAKAEGK